MTPSEKKAREIVSEDRLQGIRNGDAPEHEMRLDITSALDTAELRGYQRGMAEATKLMQDNLRKGLTHDEA